VVYDNSIKHLVGYSFQQSLLQSEEVAEYLGKDDRSRQLPKPIGNLHARKLGHHEFVFGASRSMNAGILVAGCTTAVAQKNRAAGSGCPLFASSTAVYEVQEDSVTAVISKFCVIAADMSARKTSSILPRSFRAQLSYV
jgi:hypothetical protein